ncbi:alpha/beta fold hydrolase [Anaerosporobacter faecicola]|uniref:alpha/beta fold hydrolase n=1 Tax=Anaerosporobacter faecicola TaxID=2718714 RepID=UPI001438B253|nr:alpha/beta hydrolase [Anaerosporobacter faecicola]
MKMLKKIGKGLLFWVPVVICAWIFFNYVETNYEKGIYKAPGEMVEVFGNKMHVYCKGQGKHTIVLLPGLGTTAPTIDFEPLVKEMAKSNKVVVIEPFGYGYSEKTKRARTIDNITEEVHEALEKSGITESVVLMPHSIAGMYAINYVNEYPEQVEAVVGIDCTLPRMCSYFDENAPTVPKAMGLIPTLGISRLAVSITPNQYLPEDVHHVYSKKDKKIMKAMVAWNGYNRNVVDEMRKTKTNMKQTEELEFPNDLPVLIFYAKDKKISSDGRTTKAFYQTYLEKLHNSQLVELDGPHYLHWTYFKEMASQTESFLEQIIN